MKKTEHPNVGAMIYPKTSVEQLHTINELSPQKNPKTLSDRNQTDQQKDKQRPSNNRNIVDWRVCVKLQDWLDDTVVTSVSKFQILIQNKPWIWTQMASICFCGSDLIV